MSDHEAFERLRAELCPWPPDSEVKSVLTHKSMLIQWADYLGVRQDAAHTQYLQRAIYRGAAVWEMWLLAKGSTWDIGDERRMCSAISLARLAGDPVLVKAILDVCRSRGCPGHRYLYRDGRERSDADLQEQRPDLKRIYSLHDAYFVGRDTSHLDELCALCESALHRYGRPRELLYLLGRVAVAEGRYGDSERFFFMFCVANPLDPASAGSLAYCIARRDVELAAIVMKRAAIWNGSEIAHMAFQLKIEWDLWKRSGQSGSLPISLVESCLRKVNEGAGTAPGLLGLIYVLSSSVLEEADRYDDAMTAIDTGLRKLPNSPDLLAVRGLLRLAAGKVHEALPDLLAGSPDPDKRRLIESLLGTTLLHSGQAAQAIVHFEKSLEIATNPNDRGALCNDLGVALSLAGYTERAEECFAASIQLLGGDPRPIGNLQKLLEKRKVSNAVYTDLQTVSVRAHTKRRLLEHVEERMFLAA